MATTKEIYDRLLLGKRVTVQLTGDEITDKYKQYESLRTGLCRLNAQNVALEITEKSIVAKFDHEKGTGVFSLDWPARRQNELKWSILDEAEPT